MISPIIDHMQSCDNALVITPKEGAHKAYLTARLFTSISCDMVAVLPDSKSAAQFMEDLLFFLPDQKDAVLFFPGYHILPFKSLSFHRQTSTQRMAVLSRLLADRSSPCLVVTCIDTLLQKLIPQKKLLENFELVMANEETDRDTLVAGLEAGGYTRTSLVEDPGEYAVRGGILDLFVPGHSHPVRMEFFGDLVESIRSFSPYTQRGIRQLSETIIVPATEAVIPEQQMPHVLARLRAAGKQAGLDAAKIREYVTQTRNAGRFPGIESMLSIVYSALDTFFAYLSEQTCIVWDSPDLLASSAADFENTAQINFHTNADEKRLCVPPADIYLTFDQVFAQVANRKHLVFKDLAVTSEQQPAQIFHFRPETNEALSSRLVEKKASDTPLKPLVEWLQNHLDQGIKVVLVVHQKSQAQRLGSLLAPYGLHLCFVEDVYTVAEQDAGIYCLLGGLSGGFVSADQGLALVTENEIFGKKRLRRIKRRSSDVKLQMIAPEELKNGDFVVHMEHGIGRYEGLCSLTVNGISQDFILIVYQDGDKLYLPVDRMEMIGKYIGVDGYTPVLDKIGAKAWNTSKEKAREEVEKMAADLLDLYARRKTNKGVSFSRPDNYYNDFETTFPFEETRDQLSAIDDVHLDMESDTPMDRLLCGDVGYGKTEVAVRAAFKAVNDGRQVAVVVPTTILAEQHLATFQDRFKNYPVHVACLSRFRSRKEQAHIIKQLAQGHLDIVIGTHRLLQKDVDFKSLGLLVIDEEQRFGVKHKETLKKKRSTVDVLALSATPIPRTLHLSLTGMRDISVIKTPPADRQPIVSYISTYEDAVVKDAVQKELARNGQVFFVHNNIKTISRMAENLQKLVPKAQIGIAHGRLSENALEKVMFAFVNRKINVLVCTTIIESGLDIPAANTMIINKAERFGLAQIYQLRGRIGRGDHQAYAYLFISDESVISKDAKKRLSALMEYRDLGSGFQIAMKDLQIRGAGTALGASQSGHIAAVGYDMFLKLLDQAVHDLKGDAYTPPLDPEINAGISTGFPADYIASVEQRLTLYRRLSRLDRVSDIADIKKELTDRYGKLPRQAENMLLKIMLRVYAIQAGIQRLDIDPATLVLTFSAAHMKIPPQQLEEKWHEIARFSFVKKHCVQFDLGYKPNQMAKALVKTKQILKAIV
ncbi:MAG TPA: transcription-repair coupling factor [Desulfotignum sp.]|nr:transcription-repair coupling factor [Desulfotignum sp.]